MEYENIKMSGDSQKRYFLARHSDRPLVVIGLNPSTADESHPDATMRKVMGFAERNGFDGFIMINLTSYRCVSPKDLPETEKIEDYSDNISQIIKVLERYKDITVLCAWGTLITSRPYLFYNCLRIISTITQICRTQYVCIDTTKDRHPCHPSRIGYCKFKDFNVNEYLSNRF